ncbi:MAG TPA: cysteine synthase family protein [Bacillota bacterium]|nr:cysteine synthase family protein [Bacillota bacterium]
MNNLTQLVGQTPLYEITSYRIPTDVQLFAKLEYFNPGGSIKDRLGFYVIQQALKNGDLKRGGTIIEATAGNTGIGLALAAIHYEMKAIFITPEHFSIEKQTLMQALGAKVIHTPTHLGMEGAIEKAKQLVQTIPASYHLNQFNNPWNPDTYYYTLGPELWTDLQGQIDTFIAGAGSCGTFTGIARFFKEKDESIKTVVVEPEGSILNGGPSGPHKTEGIGMEFIPSFVDKDLFDEIYTISDQQAFSRVTELARQEGLLVGSSSGAVLEAALQEAEQAPPGTRIVTIFPDSSERYMSTEIYKGV